MSHIARNGDFIYLYTDDGQCFCYDETRPPLGSGAMGTVYLGYDCSRNNAAVAIKRVKDEFANIPAIRQRAKQEASLMFRHNNIVEMLGYCEMQPDSGPIFIVSNYVKGINFDEFVKRNLLSFENSYKKICETLYPVFDALAYIHSKKIIHADIKPSNIMMENGRNIRLMDLGIAQVHLEDGGSLSGSGMLGTPRYAAPEQFAGASIASKQGSLDERTDIYELGVTIYELITQQNPFTGLNMADVKHKHQTTVLPYVRDIPKPLIDVLRVATSISPSGRYSSAMQFKTALQSALNQPARNPWKIWCILAIAICSSIIAIISMLMIF